MKILEHKNEDIINPISACGIILALFVACILGIILKDVIGLYNYQELRHVYPQSGVSLINNSIILTFSLLISSYFGFLFFAKFTESKLVNFKSSFLSLFFILFIFNYNTEEKSYVSNVMQSKYNYLLKNDKNYINSLQSDKLKTAIKDYKPNDFISILKDKNDNIKINQEKINNLFEVVMKIAPDRAMLLLKYTKDNYLTVNEYNDIRDKILKDFKDKELNLLQKSLLMKLWKLSINFINLSLIQM